LFDFGLAKELSDAKKAEDDLYHLTGCTGAIRYMAPEVGLNQPYNRKADVYSWAMLLWYILALEPPLATFTNSMFVDRVFKRGCRPAINGKWSKCIRKILKHSWQADIKKRLDFQTVLTTLRKEIQVSEFAYDVDDDKLSSSVRTRGTACESTVHEYEQTPRKVPFVITEENETLDYYPTQYGSTAMLEI
jgi:Protein tyrosine and serine/threonine kinase